jgi:hypothetical protein
MEIARPDRYKAIGRERINIERERERVGEGKRENQPIYVNITCGLFTALLFLLHSLSVLYFHKK